MQWETALQTARGFVLEDPMLIIVDPFISVKTKKNSQTNKRDLKLMLDPLIWLFRVSTCIQQKR